jgi:hypothetical protein
MCAITTTSYLANRRSASAMTACQESFAPAEAERRDSEFTVRGMPVLKRQPSSVRMTTTQEGAAKIITDADFLPVSPQLEGDTGSATSCLEVTRSDADPWELLDTSQQIRPELVTSRSQPKVVGRSRDSRTWEFWCDSDARNSLAEKANHEQSGSAADAIGMIRSNCRGALKSNPNKRNARVISQDPGSGVKSISSNKKPQFERAASSYGRLESQLRCASECEPAKSNHRAPKSKSTLSKAQSQEYEVLQTESDKENVEPETQAENGRPRAVPHNQLGRHKRKILGENMHIMSQSNSLGSLMARDAHSSKEPKRLMKAVDAKRRSKTKADDLALHQDDTLSDTSRTSASGEDEMSVVANLLSLKQGAWTDG